MKNPLCLQIIFILFILTSCSDSSGTGSKSGEYRETGSKLEKTIYSTAVNGSSVFIEGRNIAIKPFIMEDHEVTQKEYQTYCTYRSLSPKDEHGKGDDYPVYNVSWYDTLVYCNRRSIDEGFTPCYTIKNSTNPNDWGTVPNSSSSAEYKNVWNSVICNFNANGYRLPTDVEWEYATRGKTLDNSKQTIYSGSNNAKDVAWYYDNSGNKTHPVKTKNPNAAGLYDMSGNVWEWCWDWRGEITSTTPATGSPTGERRVVRGGHWGANINRMEVSYKEGHNPPTDIGSYLGFRVCRTK